MSKTVSRGASNALAMARDAFGNLMAGNDERSLRFLSALIKTLEATVALAESKNGVKENSALEALLRSQVEMENDWPKFDGSKVQENFAKWAALGITPDMGLTGTKP